MNQQRSRRFKTAMERMAVSNSWQQQQQQQECNRSPSSGSAASCTCAGQ
jgi:5'-3' exonuclease